MTDVTVLGGKAANLVWLRDAGFPVPPFVVLDTSEYSAFVEAHGLAAVIADAVRTQDPAAASEHIRKAFRQPMGDEQRARIAEAVAPLLIGPVAVRSSATAEDLPDLSFAGQQDTYLEVHGLDEVLAAVVECWSSLWTERAITYRVRNGLADTPVALAVVVQEEVEAEASGVLFTADPLTGHRGHTSVDAVAGLGEKLVSGQVVPDHFLVDTVTGDVLERTLQDDKPSLTDAQLRALVRLGERIEQQAGTPQDIEWTRVGDELQIVQARAITTLFPLPEAATSDTPLWFSFGAVQGMLEPITPLGRDALRHMLSGIGRIVGRGFDYRTNTFIWPAGERLWIRLDGVLRSELGHRVMPRVLPIVEPGAGSIVARLKDEPAFAPHGALATVRAAQIPARLLRRLLPGVPHALRHPDGARQRVFEFGHTMQEQLAARLVEDASHAAPEARLAARRQTLVDTLGTAFPRILPEVGSLLPVALISLAQVRRLAAATGLPDADQLALSLTRAVPGNVTTDMDLALWDVAKRLREDPDARAAFTDADPADLAAAYLSGSLPAVAQDELAAFLGRYGFRGVAEIDVGTRRWREQPEAVLRTLVSYLGIPPESAPDALYARGQDEAAQALARLAAASTPRRARALRFWARRLRGLIGVRETPKFIIMGLFGQLREALLASGADLVDAGLLDDPSDIVLLGLDDLPGAFERPAAGPDSLRERVAGHRAAREREQRRTRVPLLMVGDGRTFYEGVFDTGDADLVGMGVSPGVVEAAVRVVDDPRTSQLQPGEILVCRGTDPAWTPLFLTAGGLITEVGGLMTHGSVVAREYGIPAAVGVAAATTRLATGQRIRLDGTSGAITVLT